MSFCPCLLGISKFKEPHTHLVTWFSTFTWGARRAGKSLEAK
jgi:hypothetical protein